MSETTHIYTRNPDADTLGGRLSRARDAAGMSSAQLARRIGVKSSTMQAWESDRSEPRANRLTMLAGFLGVTPTWLLCGVGNGREDAGEADELTVVRSRLARLKTMHAEMGEMIARAEDDLGRISGSR